MWIKKKNRPISTVFSIGLSAFELVKLSGHRIPRKSEQSICENQQLAHATLNTRLTSTGEHQQLAHATLNSSLTSTGEHHQLAHATLNNSWTNILCRAIQNNLAKQCFYCFPCWCSKNCYRQPFKNPNFGHFEIIHFRGNQLVFK